MEFSSWLRKQTGRNDSVGDFARDVKADRGRGRISGFTQWFRYLNQCGACDGAVRACRQAWGEFNKVKAGGKGER